VEKSLFGQILLNFNLVTEDQLDRAIEIQREKSPKKRLGEIFMEEGMIDEKTITSILNVQKRKKKSVASSKLKKEEGTLQDRLREAKASDYLMVAKELGASDLYLSSQLRPTIRLNGKLVELPTDEFDFDSARTMLFSMLSKEQVNEYYSKKYLDFCLELPGVGRFRTNIYRHYRGIAGTFRVIADTVWPFSKTGLPQNVRNFINFSRGLVLITGPTGSGKSTTLTSLVDQINRSYKRHIITIEDPIEVVFQSKKSLISQREIPTHSQSFATALRVALREDPDVIVVGEMRDPETVATAITAAETGHLVFGTLHTHNAYRTVMRVLDQFPAQKRQHIRTLLASVLRAVVSQQLIPHKDGKGRSLATDIMVVNSAIANLIREDKVWQIPMVMQTGARFGMRMMDDSIMEMYQAGKITLSDAKQYAVDPRKFAALPEK